MRLTTDCASLPRVKPGASCKPCAASQQKLPSLRHVTGPAASLSRPLCAFAVPFAVGDRFLDEMFWSVRAAFKNHRSPAPRFRRARSRVTALGRFDPLTHRPGGQGSRGANCRVGWNLVLRNLDSASWTIRQWLGAGATKECLETAGVKVG